MIPISTQARPKQCLQTECVSLHGSPPKNAGSFDGLPYNMCDSIWEPLLGPPVYGNSHIPSPTAFPSSHTPQILNYPKPDSTTRGLGSFPLTVTVATLCNSSYTDYPLKGPFNIRAVPVKGYDPQEVPWS